MRGVIYKNNCLLAIYCLGLFGFIPAFAVGHAKLPPVLLKDVSAEVTAASSPDNTHKVLVGLLREAKRSIEFTGYTFTSDQLADELVAAAKRGVSVKMLLDGWPVGRPRVSKIEDQTLYIAKRIVDAGGDVSFMASDRGDRADRPFVYVHSKYVVIDEETVYVSSENFGPNAGHSVSRTIGNRGWAIGIKNSTLAATYSDVFKSDWNGPGVVAYGAKDYVLVTAGFAPDRTVYQGVYKPVNELKINDVMTLERVMSPDDSFSHVRAMGGAIRSAKATLVIQNLSFAPHWGKKGDSSVTAPSFLADEVLEAARRGVQVRIMLQPAYFPPPLSEVFDGQNVMRPLLAFFGNSDDQEDSRDNKALIEDFRAIAKKEALDLQANFFWNQDDGIRTLHNKGMVVDAKTVLVSSINWVENSVKNNREAAVLVTHPLVAGYYQKLFELDWRENRNTK